MSTMSHLIKPKSLTYLTFSFLLNEECFHNSRIKASKHAVVNFISAFLPTVSSRFLNPVGRVQVARSGFSGLKMCDSSNPLQQHGEKKTLKFH